MAEPTFLDGINEHLRAFAASAGVSPDAVFVRIALADGTFVFSYGLRLSAPVGPGGWGMIDGVGEDAPEAVVIRESSVFRIQFLLDSPKSRPPIGYMAEGDRPH